MKPLNIVQFILAYIILGFSFWSGYIGKLDVMIVAFISFILIVFINNLDKISEIKATAKGFEAKTREIVEKAEVTIEQLQKIALVLADTELSVVIRSGRWGGFTKEEKEKLKNSVLSILDQLKIPVSEQEKILDHDWNRYIIFDYAHALSGGSYVPDGLTSDQLKEWEALRSGGVNNPATPEQLKNFLEKYGYLNQEIEEFLKDYEYFLKNKKHRRPEVWKGHLNLGQFKKVK